MALWICNTNQIKNALASFKWQKALSNNCDRKISALNETIINVMSNYILSETGIWWPESALDECGNWEFNYCKKWSSKNNWNCCFTYKYKALQGKLENLIGSLKQSYYIKVSKKLFSVSANSKSY